MTVRATAVTGSHSDGIYLSAASASSCTGNTVTGNGGEGIENGCGSGVTVADNTESGNAGGNSSRPPK